MDLIQDGYLLRDNFVRWTGDKYRQEGLEELLDHDQIANKYLEEQ